MKSIIESIKESLIHEGKLVSIGKYKAWIRDWKLGSGIHFPDGKLNKGIILDFDRDKNPDFSDNSIIVQLVLSPEDKDYCIDGGKIAYLCAREEFFKKTCLAEYHGSNSLEWAPEPAENVKDLIDEIIKTYNI